MDVQSAVILLIIFTLIGAVSYFIESTTDKMLWRKYIQKCLETDKEPTMTLNEHRVFVREQRNTKYKDEIKLIEAKKQAERANNDKYYDDVESWMKKLKK